MHTTEPFSAGVANADAPGREAVQHPTQASHFGPVRVCCADTDAVAVATSASAAAQRFIETIIVELLMSEAYIRTESPTVADRPERSIRSYPWNEGLRSLLACR
jgi:hypothetical protein